MKILKVIMIVVVVLLALFFAGAWFAAFSLDVNRYIPQAADAVAKATGRQLTVGHAGLALSFNKGAVLELKDVRLSDAPQFSDTSFLIIDRVVLALDVRAIIAEKSIVVSEVNIISPEITVIRAKNGSINAAAMAPQGPSASSAQPSKGSAAAALPALLVRKIRVQGGSVHYIDRLMEPALAVDIEKITLDINDLSLARPFNILLGAALFSSEENITATGRASVDIARAALRFDGLKAVMALDKIKPEKLNDTLSMLRPIRLKQIAGKINVDLKQAVIGAKGLEGLDAGISCEIKSMIVEGINALAAGLNSIPLPGLVDSVIAELPSETQTDIQKGITAIDRLDILAGVDKDRITVHKSEMATRDLSVSGVGTVSMAGVLDMSAKLLIAPKLSDLLVNKVKDLGGLRKEDQRIVIPFSISGPAGAPQVRPDVEYLTKNMLLNRGKQELQKVLGDPAIGEAVGDLFNSLFKGK